MRKSYRKTALFKSIAGVTAAGMFGLSISSTAFAFDSQLDGNTTEGVEESKKVVWPYVVGGLALIGGVWYLLDENSDDDAPGGGED